MQGARFREKRHDPQARHYGRARCGDMLFGGACAGAARHRQAGRAAQTATNFNGTTDGREGWTQHFHNRTAPLAGKPETNVAPPGVPLVGPAF